MVHVEQAIVVEGRYDKNTLSQIVDTVIFQTNGFPVNLIDTFSAAVKLSGNGNRFPVGFPKQTGLVIQLNGNGSKSGRFPAFCSGENNIFHAISTQQLRGLFPQYPANRIADIAFSATVWPNHGGQALFKFQFHPVRKGLKSLQFQRFEKHRIRPFRFAAFLPEWLLFL